MIGTVIIAAIVALLFSSLGTLMALKIQHRYLQRTHAHHKAWEQAQEGYQRNWEMKQEKRTLSVEAKLASRVQQLERDWQAWEKKDALRIEAFTQQYLQTSTVQHVERELARLPLVEETPLAFNRNGQHLPEFSHWQPPALARADLAERDLSHRYLGQADLREAQLHGASFFMSDLSGACLVGANLTGADLTGANLSHADLRNSVLTNANLQVADLSQAVLLGANLHGASNLTTQQVYAAIYDHTTQLDVDIDLTVPRLPVITQSMLKPTSLEQAPVIEPATPTVAAPETIEPVTEVETSALDGAALTALPVPVLETTAQEETPSQEALALSALEVQAVPASIETSESIDAEITETTAAVEFSATSKGREVITETPVLTVYEEAESPIQEEAVVPVEALVAQEEFVIAEIEPGLNGSHGKTNGTNGHNHEHDEASENADTVLVHFEPSELAGDETVSEYAATTEAADAGILMPLVFPRSLEVVEEDDTFVLPAFKKTGAEEEALLAANEPQLAVDVPEPDPDSSSSPALDDSLADEKPARVLADVHKNKRRVPIDITTQKGKYNGSSKRRARAR